MKLGINLENTQPESGSKYSVLAAGEYTAKIVGTEVKETKKGGYMLILDLETKDGTIAERINISNDNPEAVRIGLARLKLIATLIDHKNPNFIDDSDELLHGKINIIVEVKESEFEGKVVKQNNIKAILKCQDKTSQETPFSAPADKKPASEMAPANNLPWMKK